MPCIWPCHLRRSRSWCWLPPLLRFRWHFRRCSRSRRRSGHGPWRGAVSCRRAFRRLMKRPGWMFSVPTRPERSVRAAFADAILIRPAVMFGPDDAFLTTILKLLGRFSIYPMFGRGLTRLQPADVEDVADAVARALQWTEMHAITFECGGPRVYSYKELLRAVAHEASLKPMLIPIPFAAWHP